MAETSGAELIVDALVIGGGPAGLSAALNLGRARATVLLADAGRPRNAATLRSHGFLTRDGVPPIELRKLGIAELAQYPDVQVAERTPVTSLDAATDAPDGIRFLATLAVRGAGAVTRVAARSVLVAVRLLTADRWAALATGLGIAVATLVFSGRGPGGAVIVAQAAKGQFDLGLVWTIAVLLLVVLIVAWPDLSGVRREEHVAIDVD